MTDPYANPQQPQDPYGGQQPGYPAYPAYPPPTPPAYPPPPAYPTSTPPAYPTSTPPAYPAYGAPYPPAAAPGVPAPTGRFPLRGTNWTVQDSTQVTEAIPTWAIVLAIVFALMCLLGLLFLLVKEKKYSGFISVTVVGEGLYHSVQLPPGPVTAAWATHQVNQARALASAAM